MYGKTRVWDFVTLCAELANLWDTDEDEEKMLDEAIEYGLNSCRFLRTAWILSEMAEKHEFLLRKIRQKFPLLHQRLRDRLPEDYKEHV